MIGSHSWRVDFAPQAESGPVGWIPIVGTDMAFTGTAGNDTKTGTSSADTFDMSQGGVDSVSGLDGDDVVFFGKTLAGSDHVDGGAGNDTVELLGDATLTFGYAVLFTATSLIGVENIKLDSASGFPGYSLTLVDANCAAGQSLSIAVNSPGFSQNIFVDASAETNGHIQFTGGLGDDGLVLGSALAASDHVNGAGGVNFLALHGDYSAGLVLGPTTVLNFFEIDLDPGFSYNLTLDDATCAFNKSLHIMAPDLAAGQSLILDASADTDGRLFVTGGAGNDTITMGSGTTLLPQVDLTMGGNDTVIGGDGTDLYLLGGALNAGDNLDGGGSGGPGFSDFLDLNGDYAAGVVFTATTITNIEEIQLHPLHTYKLTLADGNVASGAPFVVDGSSLGATDQLIFDDTAETTAGIQVIGGAGNDTIRTGGGGDELSLFQGGNDIADGGAGADSIDMADTLTAADKIAGGTGIDTLLLSGDYSVAVTFNATTITGIETIMLAAGSNYNLVSHDGNVASGATLTVDGSALHSANTLTFNGAAELNGLLNILGGAGADTLTGGHKNDTLTGNGGDDSLNGGAGSDTFVPGSGNDTLTGGLGGDDFVFEGNLTTADVVHGDLGFDTIILDGNYTLVFSATMMTAIEGIHLDAGRDYTLTFDDANVAGAKRLIVNGAQLAAGDVMIVDGSHETNGKYTFTGGDDNDTLTGGALGDRLSGSAGNDILMSGAGTDVLTGGRGADFLDSGTGPDTYVYPSVLDSTGPGYDTLHGFNAAGESIDITGTVAAIDTAVTSGSLSTATFDADLHIILDAAHLHAGDAVLVTASAGTLAGETFLVVDMNGVAAYQAGRDLVLHLDAATNLGSLSPSDFI